MVSMNVSTGVLYANIKSEEAKCRFIEAMNHKLKYSHLSISEYIPTTSDTLVLKVVPNAVEIGIKTMHNITTTIEESVHILYE